MEARTFFGQPDLKPMQDELMQEMRNRLMAGIAAMDPAEVLRTWMPATPGFEQIAISCLVRRLALPPVISMTSMGPG